MGRTPQPSVPNSAPVMFFPLSMLMLTSAFPFLGCWFTLSFLNDPVFGDAVLQENGWSWFASNLTASLLPVAAVVIAGLWSRRSRRELRGFEVVRRSRAAAE